MSETRASHPSRAGTVAITAHLPREFRDRLKILATRQSRTMNDMLAKALSDPFTKYGGYPLSPESSDDRLSTVGE